MHYRLLGTDPVGRGARFIPARYLSKILLQCESMQLSFSELCTTFHERASWTNQIIKKGLSSRLGILEETITDFNLIEISNKHSEHILTRKYSRREEGSKSGADWLWCIGEPGSWLSVLIQAKIVNPRTGTCNYLNYRKGKQRSLLLKFARQYNLLPMYCIYCHVPSGYTPSNKVLPSLSRYPSEEWACSLLTPKQVRQLLQRKQTKGSDLLDAGIPWLYPFCQTSAPSRNKLGPAVANALSVVRAESSRDVFIAEAVKQPGKRNVRRRIRWEDRDPEDLLTKELPRIAVRLLRSKIKPSDSPVSGISVISSVPVEAVLSEYKALPSPTEEPYFFDLQEDIELETAKRKKRR